MGLHRATEPFYGGGMVG